MGEDEVTISKVGLNREVGIEIGVFLMVFVIGGYFAGKQIANVNFVNGCQVGAFATLKAVQHSVSNKEADAIRYFCQKKGE